MNPKSSKIKSKKSYAIIYDSSSYDPKWKYANHHYLLPLNIIINDKNYQVNSAFFNKFTLPDINNFRNLKAKISTSHSSQKSIKELIEKLEKEYDKIIILSLHKKVSSQYDSICNIISQLDLEVQKRIFIFDTRNASKQIFYLMQKIDKWYQKDKINFQVIINELIPKNIAKHHPYLVIDDIKIFRQSGRIPTWIKNNRLMNMIYLSLAIDCHNFPGLKMVIKRKFEKAILGCINFIKKEFEVDKKYKLIISKTWNLSSEIIDFVKENFNLNNIHEIELTDLPLIIQIHSGNSAVGLSLEEIN